MPPQAVPTAQYAHAGVAAPSHQPSCPQVAVESWLHSLSGSVRVGMDVQAPFAPPDLALLHAWHSPAHAELQQYPSTQLPLEHCAARVHWEPCASSGAQVDEPLQK